VGNSRSESFSARHARPRVIAHILLTAAFAALLAFQGCSIRKFASSQLADALAASGGSSRTDDDPELIRDAAPFNLKLIETLLAENPQHEGLLLSACSGFTQYAYAFVQQDADEAEGRDLETSRRLQERARKLYLRAKGYGLRGLEVRHPGFGAALRADPKSAAAQAVREDVPFLYWTAAAWALAISLSKDSPEAVADLPAPEALVDRALQLDEAFDSGAIHVFLVTYEMSRPGGASAAVSRARRHYERSVQLSHGLMASPHVALAEAVSVKEQNRPEFKALLEKALAIDADAKPDWRLQNLISQRRARWLLARTDELFVD
jgi:predicted anti-sigma-YlaC factor YlaD